MRDTEKEDRRVRKTKKALRLGLASLLKEKKINQITVRELVDKVDIHRSTFYANFEDLKDLYVHMGNVALEEIGEILNSDYMERPAIAFENLLTYLLDNKQITSLFFTGNATKKYMDRITSLFMNTYLGLIEHSYKLNIENELLEHYCLFYFSGNFAIIGKWVTGESEQSKEAMVKLLVELDDMFRLQIKEKFSGVE